MTMAIGLDTRARGVFDYELDLHLIYVMLIKIHHSFIHLPHIVAKWFLGGSCVVFIGNLRSGTHFADFFIITKIERKFGLM